jgi:heme-degrading monooxygenase HmoA
LIAVIFEVHPASGQRNAYLDIAASLLGELRQVEGFISVERFQSLTRPDVLLSLSFWENEDAVRRWRCSATHRSAQHEGRSGVFSEYRLRVASVIRDYGLRAREQAPEDSRAAHGGEGTWL